MSELDLGLDYRGGVAAPTAAAIIAQRIPVAAETQNSGTEYAINPVLDWESGPDLADVVALSPGTTAGQIIYWDGGAWSNPANVLVGDSVIYLGASDVRSLAHSGTRLYLGINSGDCTHLQAQASTRVQLDVAGAERFAATETVNYSANPIAIGADPATTGTVRFEGEAALYYRNNADTGNVLFAQLGGAAGDAIYLGDSTNVPIIYCRSSTSQRMQVGGYDRLTIASTEATFNFGSNDVIVGDGFVSIGTTPATTGAGRFENNSYLYWRNAANTGNIEVLGTDATDRVYVGDSNTTVSVLRSGVGGASYIQVNGVNRFWVNATGANLALEAGSSFDFGGAGLKNVRDARGNATTIATGSGDTALKMTGDTTTLTLVDIVDDDEVNTVGFRVRVEDSDGSDAYTDVLEVHLKRTSGDIRVTDGAGTADSGATASLTLYGPDSGYEYTLALSDTANTLQLQLAQDASTAREARVTSWWDAAEDVS